MIKSKLIVITQLGQETLSEEWLNFKTISIKHLQSLIYDILPSMYHHEDYKIYWRYDETNFFEIYDYFSLYTALFLMSEKVLYMVVRDVYWWNVKDVDRLDGEVDAVSAVARDQLTTLKFYTVDFRQRFLVIAALKKGIDTLFSRTGYIFE